VSFDRTLLDPDDFEVFDGQEVVKPLYTHYDPMTDQYTSSYEVRALFRASSNRFMGVAAGESSTETTYIHIPASDLRQRPSRGDLVQRFNDAGFATEQYVVQEVDLGTLGVRYKLVATRV
jgi:cytolysin (calcineurin-like family phosphatase)